MHSLPILNRLSCGIPLHSTRHTCTELVFALRFELSGGFGKVFCQPLFLFLPIVGSTQRCKPKVPMQQRVRVLEMTESTREADRRVKAAEKAAQDTVQDEPPNALHH